MNRRPTENNTGMTITLPGDRGFQLTSADGTTLKRAPALVFEDRLFIFYVDQILAHDVAEPDDHGPALRRFARFEFVQRDQSSTAADPRGFGESVRTITRSGEGFRVHDVDLPVDFGIYKTLRIAYAWREIQATEDIAFESA